jgi:hypothetical protein
MFDKVFTMESRAALASMVWRGKARIVITTTSEAELQLLGMGAHFQPLVTQPLKTDGNQTFLIHVYQTNTTCSSSCTHAPGDDISVRSVTPAVSEPAASPPLEPQSRGKRKLHSKRALTNKQQAPAQSRSKRRKATTSGR